jgi:hypothetical protein
VDRDSELPLEICLKKHPKLWCNGVRKKGNGFDRKIMELFSLFIIGLFAFTASRSREWSSLADRSLAGGTLEKRDQDQSRQQTPEP